MGWPMAHNLARNFPIKAYDPVPKDTSASNLEVVASLDDLQDCDVWITMLPNDAAVDETLSQLVSSPRLVMDCSTVDPQTSRKWNQRFDAFVDAPVSGGVKGATDGTLTFMVGGDAVEEARPYLSSMGSRVIHCGGSGTGAAAKLCNNVALAAQMAGICEALRLGEALDLDPKVLTDVMNQSTAGCWSSRVNNPHPDVGENTPATRDYNGGFACRLMLKDLELALGAARRTNAAVPVADLTRKLYNAISEHTDWGHKDFGVLLQFLESYSDDLLSDRVPNSTNEVDDDQRNIR